MRTGSAVQHHVDSLLGNILAGLRLDVPPDIAVSPDDALGRVLVLHGLGEAVFQHHRVHRPTANVHQDTDGFLGQQFHGAGESGVPSLHLLGPHTSVSCCDPLGTDIDLGNIHPVPPPVVPEVHLPAEELFEIAPHLPAGEIGRRQGSGQGKIVGPGPQAARLQ